MEYNQPQCILYDITNKIHTYIYVSFNPILALGTILYGTLINNYFICEDITLYKNNKLNINLIEKYKYMEHILNHYLSECRSLHSYSFKLPYLTKDKPIMELSQLNYPIYGIIQIKHSTTYFKLNHLFGHFKIIRLIDHYQVYHLYIKNGNDYIFYESAFINDIKTNYFVRKLFKQKTNYKNIEHSDDEEEPVINEAYVTCLYINTHNKWKPYKLNIHNKVDNHKKIKYIETTYT
tara:strand:- start:459 stop:1163 length:705 start_codon:yes stop_codon:yes gene_type:complete